MKTGNWYWDKQSMIVKWPLGRKSNRYYYMLPQIGQATVVLKRIPSLRNLLFFGYETPVKFQDFSFS